MKKILHNIAMCKLCGDILESEYRHDFRQCSCGAMAVDGGHSYISRAWDPNYGGKDDVIEEMSIIEGTDDPMDYD